VVVLDSGNIKAYSDSGRPLWTYSARGRLSPYITRSREGTCYISRTNGTFIAVNRAGRELWRVNPGGPLSAPAIPGWDGRIFVPTDKRISCYTASGRLLWKQELSHKPALSPALDQNGGILTVLDSGDLIRIDPFGSILSRKLSGVPAALISVVNPADAGKSGVPQRVLVFYKNSRVEALDPADPEGRPHILPRLPAPPVAATARGNRAAVLLNDGRVVLVSGDNGAFLWMGQSHIGMKGASGNPAGDPEAVMIYDERGIYVLSKSGASGFTEDGRRLWYIHLEGTAAIPAFGDDGILYSGGADWILYAYKLEDRVRTGNRSLYGPAPEGNYGTGRPPPSPWADYYFRFDEAEINSRLEHISGAVSSGNIGENELSYLGYLMEVGGSAAELFGADKNNPPVQARERVRAIRLLGSLGSRETIPFLVNVFTRDDEPLVKAAAASAVGSIGLDPEGIALRAFAGALYSPSLIREDQIMTAAASAIGALCRFSGPPLSDTGVRLLTILSGDTMSASVRARARQELNTLRP
jgi:outer membrane protein assembly factor BamB